MMRAKTGGRAKGTPNKITKDLRETLKIAVAGELERLPETLDELSPKERLEMLAKLIPYCMPKVESIGPKYDAPGLLDWDWN